MKIPVRESAYARALPTRLQFSFRAPWVWMALLGVLAVTPQLPAQVPGVINHLGFVQVNGIPFDGNGRFKFALVDAPGTATYWSHDGTSVAGAAPTSWITNLVAKGRYAVGLGDTTVVNMTQVIPPSVFANAAVYLRIWFDDGVHGQQQLSPDKQVVSVGYAMRAATVSDNAISSAQLAANAVQGADILDGTVASADIADNSITTADILNGTLTTADFNLANIDVRYVLKTGDTMSGALTAPKLTTPSLATGSITNLAGLLSIKSLTDIELTIDNGGAAAAAFEIFNGAGNHLFILSETGNAHVFGNFFADGNFGVGTTATDTEALAQFNLPSSVSVAHVRIKSPLGNAGFGLQFVNPDERWFVGPNIGNWSDDRFNILSDSSNKGIIIAPNGNVGIDSVSAASPFATLTVDGSIGFPTVATPMMYIYPSGTANAQKPVIVHSPGFPGYGLFYQDEGDRFSMQSSPTDTTPSLMVDLDSNWVTIATDTPKPGYELSVNGQVVCEELLVQDSADWPDYVFNDDYPLRSLAEVETHIKERKHLPGIPAGDKIEKEGIRVGDMQRRMMEKIEELTLYVIDQNKRLAAQDQRIRQLETQRHPAATTP